MSAEAPGAYERRLARGALLQQVAQLLGTLAMLGAITVLGRSLSLDEFGIYGVLVAIATNLLALQLSLEGAAVRAMSAAPSDEVQRSVASTALALYLGSGLVVGVSVALLGLVLAGPLAGPEWEAPVRDGTLALGAAIAAGWPLKVFQDILRARQLFGSAAAAEVVGYLTFAIAIGIAVALDAPLWILIGLGGSVPGLVGCACLVAIVALGLPLPRLRSADRSQALEMTRVAAHLFVAGLADMLTYACDRILLAAQRSTAAVGLYEGAVRPHNVLRQLTGTLVLTVLPAASGFRAAGDRARLRDLLLRGTRYVVAIVAPCSVVLIVLSEPVLEVWLGQRYRDAAPALAILSSYWLVTANGAVAAGVLVAAGRVRELAVYAWSVAIATIALALLLVPGSGPTGAALAIALPPVVLLPALLYVTREVLPFDLRSLAREVWLPSYPLAAAMGLLLLLADATFDLSEPPALVAAALAGLAGYALAWVTLFATPGERLLLRSLPRTLLP